MKHSEMNTNVESYSSHLEANFASDNDERFASADMSLRRVGSIFPNQAVDIYRTLARLEAADTSRLAAARSIGFLAAHKPEDAAALWMELLGDSNIEIARQAYNSFSDYCYEVQGGQAPESGLMPMSRMLEVKFSENKPTKVV
jgi:HEAT repeat protein